MNMKFDKKAAAMPFIALSIVLMVYNSFSKPVQQKEHDNQIKIACVGNSITFGAGISDRIKDSYPSQLHRMLGENYNVKNFGVSARTMLNKGDYPYTNEKTYRDALAFQPDIVIIKLGTNDTKPHNWRYQDEFIDDCKILINSFQELPGRPDIYLCKPVPAFPERWGIRDSVIINGVIPKIEKIAAELKIKVIDLYTPFIGKSQYFPDKIHPNAEGAGEIAKIIYKSLTGKVGELIDQPFPGKKSKWKNFDRYDFDFYGYNARIVVPENAQYGNPWIWRARFPGWHTEMDSILLSNGYHVVYINTNNMYGSPAALKIWDRFYKYLTTVHNFNKKAALEGVSRGGLFIYNWAKKNPEQVSCIYTEAPVCDFKSWPGGFGKGKGSQADWEHLKEVYGFKDDDEAQSYRNNPIDSLENLARAKVPLLHMIGLNDRVVPPGENTFVLIDKYIKFGGIATVVPCTEGKQDLWGHHFPIETPQFAADFIMYHIHLPKQPLDAAKYHQLRNGLDNCRIKFEKEKKGRAAFLGGSITYNPGWRDKICQYLQIRFPDTKFEFINAGIPSMGSTPGAFRFDRDVLRKGGIDLLFVEAAVNDQTNGRTAAEQIRGMEGIVRHARKANPAMDIVLMHFVDPPKMKVYNNGKIPLVIQNHEKVAAHYNLPSINLAKEVTERINAGEFDWENDFKDLHPSPFGQEIYFQSMKTLLDNTWSGMAGENDEITNYPLPEKIDPFCYDKGKLISIYSASFGKGWKILENWKPQDGSGTRAGYVNVPMLTAETAGTEMELKFKGKAVGIAVAAGKDAGMIEYCIDDSEYKKLDLYTKWSRHLHLPWYYVLAADLKPGKHKLVLRISRDKNSQSEGNACRIKTFFINED